MSEDQDLPEVITPAAPATASAPRVRTLLVCDIAESTALVERLGDSAAAELIRRHDRSARDLLHRHGGREIDKTDGFLALFERPVEAVAFALEYQRVLRALSDSSRQQLRARVGVHVGEVVVWENSAADVAEGAKSLDVEGLAKPVAARLMALALPGQILLSGVAFSLAQRAERELDMPGMVRWLTHGRYRFKGVPAPMLVHEVGEAGVAPLQAPPSSGKAERDVPLWRKPGMLALEALALVTAFAVPFALTLRAPPAIAFGERDWVVVGELRNLTGESVLDDSLETAFRISLEQSRYVNVLPDLKLRDALARMQRPPDTQIDRSIASEIALREGARAVILPTVAEIGGRVRVSAEVIDPHTETTVYAESADGVGAISALDSIDSVTLQLRAKLGEALKAIERDSAPLPKATTSDLDALKLYALGRKAQGEGRWKEALGFFQRATSLDPGFSTAHSAMASIHLSAGNRAEALAEIDVALAHRDRLPPRELLSLEALRATALRSEELFARWSELAEMYPDHFGAHYNLALLAWLQNNAFEDALRHVQPAVAPQNPLRAAAIYLRGTLELGLDRITDAEASLREADSLGGAQLNIVSIELCLAKHDLECARRLLEQRRESGVARNDLARNRPPILLALLSGDLEEARRALDRADVAASKVDAVASLTYRTMRLSMELELDASRESTRAALDSMLAMLETARKVDGVDPARVGLAGTYAAYAAMRLGDEPLAGRLLDSVSDSSGSYPPVRRQLLAVIQVLQSDAARRDQALAELREFAPDQITLIARRTLAEIQWMDGEPDEAIARLDRIAEAPGRAVSEWNEGYMLQPGNVILQRTALLRRAELAKMSGDDDTARNALDRFNRAWPEGERLDAITSRLRALEREDQPTSR